MLQLEKVRNAIQSIEACCGHCPVCSPDCPIAVARRAMSGLAWDLEQYAEQSEDSKIK